ncbi:MAG: hypothetical protein EOP59_05710 [Sphingomonadales bacterium]|nr:MAG: hypothetical protein EOP59_05710 [Sphingomonadales bacterium]
MLIERPRSRFRAGPFGICAAVVALLTATPASAMSVAEFLARARALQSLGALAALSPDARILRSELYAIRAAHRADVAAVRAAGRIPNSCPPATPVTLAPQQIVAELERIPPARRGMSMKAAFYDYMRRRYPCR